MEILTIHLRGFVDYAALKGIPSSELLSWAGLKAFGFENVKARISEKKFYHIIGKIGAYLDDDMLGLRVGQHLNLNTLDVIYKISLKTNTLLEALHYCHDYLQSTFPSISIKQSKINEAVAFTLKMNCGDTTVYRYIMETVLSVMAREIVLVSGGRTRITISSPYRNNQYPEDWKKADEYRIIFKPYGKNVQPLDSFGLDILIPEYLALVEEMKTEGTFLSKVRISALRMARPKLPDLDMMAYNLNLKTRTLQRKLMNEGSSYRQISEELKREISNLLLRHQRFSIADISAILGYAEPASYIHSFVKWHGKSPTQIRERLV